jgi:hypothetical protein
MFKKLLLKKLLFKYLLFKCLLLKWLLFNSLLLKWLLLKPPLLKGLFKNDSFADQLCFINSVPHLGQRTMILPLPRGIRIFCLH